MNNMSKEVINDDGTKETIVMSSDDNLNLNMNNSYCLANGKHRKESKLAQKFKNSALGADIGFKSAGFTNVTILAVVVVLAAVAIMYFMWRF